MKKQLSESDHIKKDVCRERRISEMKRRHVVLQTRQSQLERELASVKLLLLSLDKQMNHYSDYEKLVIKT